VPCYFMHLIDGTGARLDPDGLKIPAEALERAALRGARDRMAGDVQNGRLELRHRIHVEDVERSGRAPTCISDAMEVLSCEAPG